uniref:NADH dehydrogenase subunit 6 n=1 Tax=Dactylogyrus lamellatus TaxID=231327 RepID=A0A342K3U9_9PLAT|nr:NADH dehydrogenase subunit 6 [Dactylogyrus lamellatus]ALP29093.1 NADH dehydrogenase subunit 6 [Dactylogyrus lamellatus]
MLLSLSLYYFCIILFSFVNSIITYCLLLIVSALCCLSVIYMSSSFSWYAVLFYIVYVGGVYILFIFISVYLPNNSSVGVFSFEWGVYTFFLIWELISNSLQGNVFILDESFNLCSYNEGISYLFLCFLLILSFFLVSFISGSKEGFIR